MMEKKYHIRGKEHVISAEKMRTLKRYTEYGIAEYEWLRALLCNNLVGTVTEAPDDVVDNLPAYINWLCFDAPALCWGTWGKVARYRKSLEITRGERETAL